MFLVIPFYVFTQMALHNILLSKYQRNFIWEVVLNENSRKIIFTQRKKE